MNREEWLTKVCDSLKADFKKNGASVPEKIRFTCGWPSSRAFSSKNRTIGECWDKKASADGHVEIFISPVIADGVEAGAVLAHELVHATGLKGHRNNFAKLATAIGLEGKMTATKAGKTLVDRLNAIIKTVGKYPHAKLDKTMGPKKKDGTRMIKCECETCGYVVRTTRKWLDIAVPICPDKLCDNRKMKCDGVPMEEDDDDGGNN